MLLSPEERAHARASQKNQQKAKVRKPQKKGFLQQAISSWFSAEPQWKRVLVSVHARSFLVFGDALETCAHSCDVQHCLSVALAADRRSFEIVFAPPAASGASVVAPSLMLDAPADLRFRFKSDDGEQELRDWVGVVELWRDFWRSKSLRGSIVSDLLAQLDPVADDRSAARARSLSSPTAATNNSTANNNTTTTNNSSAIVVNDGAVEDMSQGALDARTLSNQIVVLIHALDANDGGSLSMSAIANTVRKLQLHFEHEQAQSREREALLERERNLAQAREQKLEAALRKVADENISLKDQLAHSQRQLADALSARDDALSALVDAKMAAAADQQKHWDAMQKARKAHNN